MHLYPAIVASMGSWSYYIVKMMMVEVAKHIGFAAEMYDREEFRLVADPFLDKSEAASALVKEFGNTDDRFMSSIVVAAVGGSPRFFPLEVSATPQLSMLQSERFDESFGVVTFDGRQQFFALDDQHRLKSIKTLVKERSRGALTTSDPFLKEEASVLMLVGTNDAECMRRYRSVATSLNRHAVLGNVDVTLDQAG